MLPRILDFGEVVVEFTELEYLIFNQELVLTDGFEYCSFIIAAVLHRCLDCHVLFDGEFA